MTDRVVLSVAVGGRQSSPGSGARLGLLARLGCATAFACWAGRLAGPCGLWVQAVGGGGGWWAELQKVASWAGSVTRARCPFSFSSIFFSFSISYFYLTLCHGLTTRALI